MLFNNTILGDDDGPAQWALPMNDETNVGIICLDNNLIQKALYNFELLNEVSSVDPQCTTSSKPVCLGISDTDGTA